MENLTNEVIELKDGSKYYIVRQALYKGTTYYLGAQTTENEEDFTGRFVFFERIEEDNKMFVQEVTDTKILQTLAKNITIEEE